MFYMQSRPEVMEFLAYVSVDSMIRPTTTFDG